MAQARSWPAGRLGRDPLAPPPAARLRCPPRPPRAHRPRPADGERQYFTRAFDFGFSKNAEFSGPNMPRSLGLAGGGCDAGGEGGVFDGWQLAGGRAEPGTRPSCPVPSDTRGRGKVSGVAEGSPVRQAVGRRSLAPRRSRAGLAVSCSARVPWLRPTCKAWPSRCIAGRARQNRRARTVQGRCGTTTAKCRVRLSRGAGGMS